MELIVLDTVEVIDVLVGSTDVEELVGITDDDELMTVPLSM